jgi:hypothetical protein
MNRGISEERRMMDWIRRMKAKVHVYITVGARYQENGRDDVVGQQPCGMMWCGAGC